MRFQVFFSLWSVTSWWCIDKIPEVTKTKVSKPNKYSLSKLRLPCPPKTARVHAKKAINCSSVDAAMSERRCVFLGESKSALFGLQKVDAIRNHWLRLFTTEWMNEWCTYIVLYSVYCTPKALHNHVGGGGGLLNHHQCAASTWLMRWLPQDNGGTSALTTHQLQVERRERVIEPIKWMGMIKRPWLTRASGGNLARTPGLHPYSLREVPWDF